MDYKHQGYYWLQMFDQFLLKLTLLVEFSKRPKAGDDCYDLYMLIKHVEQVNTIRRKIMKSHIFLARY